MENNNNLILSNKDNEQEYSEYFPSYNGYLRRIAKVDLFYLDGTTNHMKLTLPMINKGCGGTEEAYKYLAAFVNELTKYYITISHYQITMGCINEHGEEEYVFFYNPVDVPINAVYQINWPLGAFVCPLEVKRKRAEIMQERINKGEHPDYGNFPFPYNEC